MQCITSWLRNYILPTTKFKNLHTFQNNLQTVWLQKLNNVRKAVKKPLSFAEKILYTHTEIQSDREKVQNLDIQADHIAIEDRQALFILQQLELVNSHKKTMSCSLHCDGIIQEEYTYTKKERTKPTDFNEAMHSFFKSASSKHKVDFWPPGSGSSRQVVIDNYVVPGGFIITTDFYASFSGGLACMGLNIDSSTAIDSICGIPLKLDNIKVINAQIVGVPKKFIRAHDIVSKLQENLQIIPNDFNIVEFSGPGIHQLSCLEMAKICQLGADIGISISLFPYTFKMHSYLKLKGQRSIANSSKEYIVDLLSPDKDAVYDDKITLNLNETYPYISIPFIPSIDISINNFQKLLPATVPRNLHMALIGKYSMLTYKELRNCADIAKQALSHGKKSSIPLKISTPSQDTLLQMEKEGVAEILRSFGAQFPAISCIETDIIKEKSVDDSAIITSCSRKLLKEFYVTPASNVYVSSPELVIIYSITGSLDFNPLEHQLKDDKGEMFSLEDSNLEGIIRNVYRETNNNFDKPIAERQLEHVEPQLSKWIHSLQPLEPYHKDDYKDMFLLLKVKGNCGMDAISPDGPWSKYCGNLNIFCKNIFLNAVNAESGYRNQVKSRLSGKVSSIHSVASSYKAASQPWIIVAEYGFGEGRNNEYAALQLRYMGCKAVLAKSFSPKMENDLKRNGILPLKFSKSRDYNEIKSDDFINVNGIENITYNKPLIVTLESNAETKRIIMNHSLNYQEIEWLKAGGATNYLKKIVKKLDTVRGSI